MSQKIGKDRALVLDLNRVPEMEKSAAAMDNGSGLDFFYNQKNNLLIMVFESARKKLSYVKQIPTYVWNRHGILFDMGEGQLETWLNESVH